MESIDKKTKQILKHYGFTFKKSLGQNFLVDQSILDQIIGSANLDQSIGVLEIGPGIGTLTAGLAKQAGKVVGVELDQRLIPMLAEVLADYSQVTIIHGDILTLDLLEVIKQHFQGMESIRVVANLPYYITTPIIMRLLEEELPFDQITVMIQKEVAERLTAKPVGKHYGSLSVAVQYYCEPEIVTVVPRSAFMPQPNVDSAVLKLTRRTEPPVAVDDADYFFATVRACFVQRRKTIFNNLRMVYTDPLHRDRLLFVLQSSGIAPERRGESVHMSEFALLSNLLLKEFGRNPT